MMSRTVDYITTGHPVIAKYGRERINVIFGTSDGRNIAVFLTAGIAAGIFAGSPNDIVKYAALGITAAVWINTSVLAGFMRQWLYIFFSALYFMIPYVFLITPDSSEAAEASEFQNMLSELLRAVPLRPMRVIAGENDTQLVSVIILLVCIALFFIGVRVRSVAKRSDFYCRTRLEQLK